MRILPLLLPLLLLGCSPSEATMRERFRRELSEGGGKWEGMDIEYRKSGIVYKVADKVIGGNRFRFVTTDDGPRIRVTIHTPDHQVGGMEFLIEKQYVEEHKDYGTKGNPGYSELEIPAKEFARVVSRLWPKQRPGTTE